MEQNAAGRIPGFILGMIISGFAFFCFVLILIQAIPHIFFSNFISRFISRFFNVVHSNFEIRINNQYSPVFLVLNLLGLSVSSIGVASGLGLAVFKRWGFLLCTVFAVFMLILFTISFVLAVIPVEQDSNDDDIFSGFTFEQKTMGAQVFQNNYRQHDFNILPEIILKAIIPLIIAVVINIPYVKKYYKSIVNSL